MTSTNGTNGHTNGANGHTNGHSNGIHASGNALCSVDEFVSQEYDFVVVGGGTAGLVVAARLTEDPNITVGVIEAGQNRLKDPSILTPGLYPTLIGNPEYDWCMTSVPQPNAGNKSYSMPRGKVLGGSSAINYLMYVRGSRADYDAWEKMGNKGWGWEGLKPYFLKHQTLDHGNIDSLDTDDPHFRPHAGAAEFHGTDGPIKTSFNDWYMPLEKDFAKACYAVTGTQNTSLKDAWSGDHMGFYSSLGAVDRSDDKGTRSYAATGYLKPNVGRKNLKVLTEAQVTRVLIGDGKAAEGVEFLHGSRQKYTVRAKREVILSAGVIQTPQLLELSGVGDPEVLAAAGVDCIVENKSVGANFQDHVLGGMVYDLKPGIDSLDALRGEEFMKAQQKIYQEQQQGPYGSPCMQMGFVSYSSIVDSEELEATISEIEKNSLAKTAFEKEQEKIIVAQLRDPTFANLQTFCIACRLDVSKGSDQTLFFGAPPEGVQQLSLIICLEHPLSRGSVHITSSDPLAPPRIDPGYFRNEVDAKILAAGLKWMDKVAKHPLMAKSLAKRELPPQNVTLESEEERVEYVKNHISTQYHVIGTAALGQVVDNECRVKGVDRLRVIDASLFPGHVSGNIMATTYATAEKASAIIKASIS